ncbi:MAG: lysophospholipid acyltransferase family protein [Methyloligellaceae bacterium]
MPSLRAITILTAFLGFTLAMMPVQLLLVRLDAPWARTLPHWFHRQVCRLVGLRIHRFGCVSDDRPVLLVSNHISWLDIPALGALAPVSFVAKQEVATWPFVSWLAKLQRTVFVDRGRRANVAETTRGIISRLRSGDHIVLFAEGTSSDGNRVLPFRTSLFAAAKPSRGDGMAENHEIYVQTLAVAYTALHGLPLGRRSRPLVAWYGDMEMASHVWDLLRRGPVDVHIRLSEPVALGEFVDRKALARFSEARIRRDVAMLLASRQTAPDAAKRGQGEERGESHAPDMDEPLKSA